LDAFSYLSVLLSIILGLAITQVLQGYRGLMLARGRVCAYAPPLIWSGVVLVLATQLWWSSFGLARRTDWTFLQFAVVLLQTVVLYMLAGLALPDTPPGEPIDLKAHFHREQRPFFGAFLVMLGVSFLKDPVLTGHLTSPANIAFHGAFLVLTLLMLCIRGPRFHEVMAPLAGVCVGVYIAALFTRLA
jgi:hypothetical protein